MQTSIPVTADHQAAVDALIQQMSLAEKIGQMTQVEKNSLQPEDVTTYFIGSVLSGGGGTPATNDLPNWGEMVKSFQDAALATRLRIPLIYGVDAVHGHNNLKDAVIFPHNIGLGAANDPALVREIARITACELLATGVHWNFAPAVSVPQDIRWGRTFEGFSEETARVISLSTAYVEGLHDPKTRVLASVKHYVGDGGTVWGTPRSYDWINTWQAPGDSYKLDQGDTILDEATLRAIHLPPYQAAIEAGAQNIMVSFSSWNGVKMHAHHYLLTDVLKGEFGFEGFLISDWMAIQQLDRDLYNCVVQSINAGLDMIMVPYDFKSFIAALTRAVEAGDVAMSRIDDAVRRILTVKYWLGLFDNPNVRTELVQTVGSDAHRKVAREAVAKSLVLLKNQLGALPISRNAKIYVAGKAADDIGLQCGGWTISWQGESGPITAGTTVLAGLRENVEEDEQIVYSAEGDFAGALSGGEHAQISIVVVAERPYAEGLGDNGNISLTDEDIALIEKMRAVSDKLVVVLLSGRPLLIADQLALADAFVAAWLPGSEAAGISDVLFGDKPFSGKLSFSWPRSTSQVPLSALKADAEPPLFPVGFGLS